MAWERLVPFVILCFINQISFLGKVVHPSIGWSVLTFESDFLTFSGLNGGKSMSIASIISRSG
jgi:hypothetical protein